MRFFPLGALLLIFVLSVEAWGSTPVLSREDQLKLTADVRSIFEEKCLDCHGAELPRPKGKFGYVLDLKRVAANPKYVVPGDPKGSDLYDLVLHDEMPGEDADVPALTLAEKEKVRRWIEVGAPSELPAGVVAEGGAAHGKPVTVVIPKAKAPQPFWKQSLRWIGKFHPVTTHFPIALMLVAVVAEAIGWWTGRESWMQTVRFLVVLAALGGLAAGVLGWVNAYFSSYDKAMGSVLWWHRWVGTGASVWAVICAGVVCIGPCAEGSPERQRFRVVLVLGAVLVSVTGFLGSALIYGLDHYVWN